MAINQEAITNVLAELDLKRDDVVLVHSDLRMLDAPRELVKLPNCGADLVIDSFLAAVGPGGLVVFPTFTKTWDTGATPYTGLVFDPASTPSRVGSITNVFRRRGQAMRSDHPTHSLTAIGSRAGQFVPAPEDQSTFDRRGPWGKMHDWDGWICFFGTDNRTNTTVHVAEDWMDLPYMEQCYAWVKGASGQPVKTLVRKAPLGPRDFYRKVSKCDKLLAAGGILRKGRIGKAEVTLMKVRDCHRVLRAGIIAEPCLLLRSESNADDWSQKACKAATEYVRSKFA